MMGLIKKALIALALLSFGAAHAQGIGTKRSAVLSAKTIIITGPSPSFGAVARTKDGSTGQTYTLNGAWTDVQWYRRQLAFPYLETPIVGATATNYVAQAGDENYLLIGRGKLAGVDAAAKAYGPVLSPPILLEDFESLSGFSATGGGLISLVTDNPELHNARLQLAGSGTVNAQVTKANIGAYDTSTLGTIALAVDVGLNAPIQSISNYRIVLQRPSGTDQYLANVTTLGLSWLNTSRMMGRSWGAYHVSEVPGLAATGSGTIGLSLRHSGNPPYAAISKYDALLARAGGVPTVIFSADDVAASQYTTLFPLMQARGMQGCFAYTKNLFGLSAAYMTKAQAREMYDAGWDACLDSTHDDTSSPQWGTLANWENNSFLVNRAAAIADGMTRGNEHVIYTYGAAEYLDTGGNPTPHYAISAVTCNGTSIATMSSTAGLASGQSMYGYGWSTAPVRRIASVDSGTQVTLDGACPSQTKPAVFVNSDGDFFTFKLPKRLAELGVKTAWTVRATGPFFSRFGVKENGLLLSRTAVSDFTQAQLQAQIDLAILRGETVHFMFHGIGPGGGLETDVAKLTWLLDYVKAKVDAGQLFVLTPSQWWARDGGASVPLSFNLAMPRLPTPANDDMSVQMAA